MTDVVEIQTANLGFSNAASAKKVSMHHRPTTGNSRQNRKYLCFWNLRQTALILHNCNDKAGYDHGELKGSVDKW